jgi:cytochrome c-type biogenesis protein CcmH
MSSPRKITPVVVLATAVLCSSFVACSKSDSGAASGIPPLPNAPAAAAPAAPAAPPPAPVAPPPAAPPVAAKPADPGARIAGQVVVAPAMRAHVAPTDTIFIVARRIPDNPTARGTLVAVKKVSAAKFPVAFELSAADMPFQNGAFDGDLQLSVRDNKSGDPIMRRKGDVFGVLPKVHVGARGVKLPLEQLQQEDESLAGAQQMLQGQLPPGHPATQ